MYAKFDAADTHANFELENKVEKGLWGSLSRYCYLLIDNEHAGVEIKLTPEQTKVLADTINEKLKEDEKC
jgi:hypothetical protein